MNDYTNKRNLIQEKINKLKEQEAFLIKSRKIFFTGLVEKLDLLAVSDECMTGLLLNFKEKFTKQTPEIQIFEIEGEKFLRKKKQMDIEPSSQTTTSAYPYEAEIVRT